MRSRVPACFALLALGLSHPGRLLPAQPKSAATATGIFLGRSGKPMAGARLILCDVLEDRDFLYARLRLLSRVPVATADAKGRFELKGFAPGATYTLVYTLPGASLALPAEISIRALNATDRSIAPLLRNAELGTFEPFPERSWGPVFTLLKGHTFWSEGAQMKIWNATVRRGQQGPYLEMRRGVIWLQKLDDKTSFKFEAWSF